jgi:poly-gamma-glutamate synthesis protein (capsule biosynthesis protein)
MAARVPMPANSLDTVWTSKKSDDGINILLTGDIMLGRYIETLRAKKGGDFPFSNMPEIITTAKSLLKVDTLDIVAGNLEGPITDKQIAYGDMTFIFKPETAALLKKVGFTTLNLANNHTFNQGRSAYTETRTALTQVGISPFGKPDEVSREFSFTSYNFDGESLGFLGIDDVDFKMDKDAAINLIKELSQEVDTLIVSIHWGTEYVKTASTSITETAHDFVDAGADMIWGHHPHVVQNSEIYNGAPIYYSLGNFVFDQYWSQETQKGLTLAVKVQDGEVSAYEIPVNLVNGGEPHS